jgi:hypothetical protein
MQQAAIKASVHERVCEKGKGLLHKADCFCLREVGSGPHAREPLHVTSELGPLAPDCNFVTSWPDLGDLRHRASIPLQPPIRSSPGPIDTSTTASWFSHAPRRFAPPRLPDTPAPPDASAVPSSSHGSGRCSAGPTPPNTAPMASRRRATFPGR